MSESYEDKVKHVKRAKQTRKHACHWPGCEEQVPPAMWGCQKHWFMLPPKIRYAIWLAYKIGQEERRDPDSYYRAAANEAQKWIKANYP